MLSPAEEGAVLVVDTAIPAGATLTVATLAFDPIESLLDARLSLDGDEVPLRVLCTVEMLSVEADIPFTPVPDLESSILMRWTSFICPDVDMGVEVVVEEPLPRRSPYKNEKCCIRHYVKLHYK